MQSLRRLKRLARIFIHLLSGIWLLVFHAGKDTLNRTPEQWAVINQWMEKLCAILGLKLKTNGEPITDSVLYTANHVSWHDIPVIMSQLPTGFVAKHEIRRWPLIGWMAHRASTLFIERGKRTAAQEIKAAMITCLEAKQNVLIFPEGTTSDGDNILTFRSRLYEAAIETQSSIQAITVRYSATGISNRLIAYRDESFLSHAWRLLGLKEITAHIHFCKPITSDGNHRRELAMKTQKQVKENFYNTATEEE